jgi:anaerobic carbon-monoxide dehydrogenase iron sulfur subunit
MALEFIEVHLRKRKTLSADSKACSGCRTCEIICSLTHEGVIDPQKSRIYIKMNPFKGSFLPMVCHQCSDAPCLYACQESAIEINNSNGTVAIIQKKCTGCRSCEKACPYKVIRFDIEKNKVFKCDFCHGDPKCVKWCPANALGVTQYGGEIS